MKKMLWKKLLSDPPSSWARLPLLTRGVGDELLRAVDASGELDCGEERPADVVCRLTGAHPRERRRVVEAVAELLQQGFLVLSQRDGRTVLRLALPDLSAPEAHPKRTRSAPEAHPKRTRSAPEAHPKLTRSRREVGPKASESLGSDSVEEKRKEEKRKEESSSLPSSPGPARAAARERELTGDVARVWEHWRQRLGKTAAARLDDRRRRRIVWALDQYGLDAVLRCLDGYAGSAWHRGENDRGTAYDDLTLWLRDAEHVERGLAMAASAPRAGRAGRAEPARFDSAASQASLEAFDAFFGTHDEVAHA